MRKSLINIILFFLLAIPALPATADIIYFKNGGELRCNIIKETDDYIILQVKSGKMKILRSSIEEIEKTQPIPLKQSEPKPVSAVISSGTIEEVDALIKGADAPEAEKEAVVEEAPAADTEEGIEPAAEAIEDIPEYTEPPAAPDNSIDIPAAGNVKYRFDARQIDPEKIKELQVFFRENIALVISIALAAFLIILAISMILNGVYIKIYSRLIVKRFIPFGKTIVFQLKFFAFEIFIGFAIGIVSALLGLGGVKGFIGIMFLWLFFAIVLIWYFFSLSNREFGFSFMQTLLMIVIYIILYTAFSMVANILLGGLFVSIAT
ncbi:MAG: hypothetical protein JW728_07610 [Candidatus Aureabacteria bacterium]|nr:hypothetical protein [Candidatus Auribacterota bacterium]